MNYPHYKELKCIKNTHTHSDGSVSINYLTFNQFEKSFINERWSGERRYNKQYTMFGLVHSKTTVPDPFDNSKSIRVFEFPIDLEDAQRIHAEQAKA